MSLLDSNSHKVFNSQMNTWFDSFSILPIPVCLLDKGLQIVEKNKSWVSEFTGQSHDQKSILSFASSTPREKLLAAFEECRNQGYIQIDFEKHLWSISFNKENETYILVGQSLNNYHALAVRYERVYQTTTDAIMLLDEKGFTDCNQATLNIFKLKSVEEFTKCHPADLSPPLQPDGENSLTKANRMIGIALEQGKNLFEWVHRNKEGMDFTCEVLLSRLEIDGKSQLQASVRDISERVRLQSEIEESKIKQLNAARLASLGEMAGGIAHEINNPLSIVRAQAEQIQTVLKRSEHATPFLLSSIERIVNTSDRISTIIKGLKQLSRDSSNDPYESNELLIMIRQLIELSSERLKLYQISLSLNCPEEEVFVLCRPVEILQVLLNLINNSIDAIGDSENPWILIDVSIKDTDAVVKLTDSGNGIDPAIVPKIAQPFFTTKDVGKGTGLGLSISKKIIEKHQGSFYLDTNSRNTTFVFTLKLGPGQEKDSPTR